MNNIEELNNDIKEYIKYVCEEEGYETPSEICLLDEFLSVGSNTLPLFEEEHYCFIRFLYKKYYYYNLQLRRINVEFMNDYINNTIDGEDLEEQMIPFESDIAEWILIRRYAWCYVYNMSEEELDSCVE